VTQGSRTTVSDSKTAFTPRRAPQSAARQRHGRLASTCVVLRVVSTRLASLRGVDGTFSHNFLVCVSEYLYYSACW